VISFVAGEYFALRYLLLLTGNRKYGRNKAKYIETASYEMLKKARFILKIPKVYFIQGLDIQNIVI